METIISIVVAIVALAIGLVVGKIIFGGKAQKEAENAKKEAAKIIADAGKEAESIKKDKMLEAKEHFLQKKSKFDAQISDREKKLSQREHTVKNQQNQLKQKQEDANRKNNELDNLKKNLNKQLEIISVRQEKLDSQHEILVKKLEEMSGLSQEDAKAQLIESLKKAAETDALSHVKSIMDEAKIKANKEAKKIVISAIQRTASENTIENTVSIFNLESDDQKGQIIGREGRNIRALENSTGCSLVVDDTPEAIVISGFDPIRREICRLALQRLTSDGRIHPARIEEVVAKTKKQLEEHIREIGERAVIDLGIQGLHPELIRYVGRMRFRSSYGQNLLQHSRETARLCASMAAELGLNVKLAKRAGLLHDIGKVAEEDTEMTHAIYGMKLCEKYGEHAAVCNAVGAHHDEIEMKFAISPIVQACDAISGARPGARREIMESYMQRIKELEELAVTYDGVEKAFAIQAGREVRVIVESGKVSDKRSEELSFEISRKIEKEMTYPGQIKVTVIREKRSVAVAR